MRVHHLAVVVSDLERAERFYAGVLGLPVERRWSDDAGRPRSLWLGLGEGAFLAVEKAARGEPLRDEQAPGWHCACLAITPGERAGWRTKLEAAGHPIVRETSFTLYVRDPDGQLVGLSHWPDAAETVRPAG